MNSTNQFSPEPTVRTWVEVDLGAIHRNVAKLKAMAGPGRIFSACVKGDGYGHGMVPVARAMLAGGAERLSVALVEEGIALREAGIEVPIQVLIEPRPEHAAAIEANRLIPALADPEVARALAEKLTGPIDVHVEVDTGMGRVGLRPEEAPAFLETLDSLGRFRVEGLFSHLSWPYQPGVPEAVAYTKLQTERFLSLLAEFKSQGRKIPLAHLAASGGLAFHPETHLDLVRPGTYCYGYRYGPIGDLLEPAIAWKSRILSIFHHPAGQPIGYDLTRLPDKDVDLALISLGYADGFPRHLSDRARVLIRGKRAKVMGLASMDLLTADVSAIPEARPGDEVVLIGRQGREDLTCGVWTDEWDLNPVVLTCGISSRVPRYYFNEE